MVSDLVLAPNILTELRIRSRRRVEREVPVVRSESEVSGLQLGHLGAVGEDGLVDAEAVLEHGADGGQGQLELELAVAVDEVALLELRQQEELAAAVRCVSCISWPRQP